VSTKKPLVELLGTPADLPGGDRDQLPVYECSMIRNISLLSFVALALSAVTANADLVWEYSSTDGTDVASGQLTTSGNPGDEATVGNTFSLISIDTAFINSTV